MATRATQFLVATLLFLAASCLGQGFASFRSPSVIVNLTAAPSTPAATCPDTPSQAMPTQDYYYQLSPDATKKYVGVKWPNNQPARTICRVDVLLSTVGGTVSGKHLKVGIWTLSGTALNTEIGSSSTVTGIQPVTYTKYQFDFASPVALSANTAYAIVVYMTEDFDAVNIFAVGDATTDTVTGTLGIWGSDKTLTTEFGDAEACFDLYWQ